MITLSPRTFSLFLAMSPGMGGRSVVKVLARNGLLGREPSEFLKLSPESYQEEYGLTNRAAQGLVKSREQIAQLLELEERLIGLGVTLVTPVDVHYPALLEDIDPDPPGVLFLYGNKKLLEANTFCVLSSRKTPPAGLDLIEKLVGEGVLSSEVLVVGHSTPEYRRAAVVPLRWGSPRILCLDRGLFPVLGQDLKKEAFNTARLWRYQFDPGTDLVVSPFRPEAEFVAAYNRRRDNLVAYLSRRMDFVTISEGGNMEKLMRHGLKAKRPVRVSDLSYGYRQYGQAGAEIIGLKA